MRRGSSGFVSSDLPGLWQRCEVIGRLVEREQGQLGGSQNKLGRERPGKGRQERSSRRPERLAAMRQCGRDNEHTAEAEPRAGGGAGF